MTDRTEIERLLQMTGRTLKGLPTEQEYLDSDDCAERYRSIGTSMQRSKFRFDFPFMIHQSDVIELLVGAFRAALDKQPRWISVEERLPEPYQHVIVHVQHTAKWVGATKREERWHAVEEDCWLGDGWECNADTDIHEVTHWMPLPEPPEEDAND